MQQDLLAKDFVFCCSPQKQRSLIKEKHGYRCSICGKFYPYLQIKYRGELIDPRELSKPVGRLYKYKKAATIFCKDHYYAHNKNTLLKFEMNADKNMQQTDVIPIMGNVYHTILSRDEKYIATETFNGTLAVVDAYTKETVAKKPKTDINGAFIFAEDGKLLYFFEDAIRCWDYLENTHTVIWSVPTDWKLIEDRDKPIYVVCSNVIYNACKQTYLFQCNVGDFTYIVSIKKMVLDEVVQLRRTPSNCDLVYMEDSNVYTLAKKGRVTLYDESFSVIESFTAPNILQISDGGGVFPVTRLESQDPFKTYVSGDGKWILMNYFTSAVLMSREDRKIKFCLFSYTGKAVRQMGFIGNDRFWYTWGDTTYIQEIELRN